MICLITLIIFGILGIFSAAQRQIAKEAFDCVFRRITLRKCTTGLDTRLKAKITSTFLEKTPKIGQFIYRYFEIISWLFTILLLVSTIWTGIAGYNYYLYGNCNGPSINDQAGLCIFDPAKENSQISTCSDQEIITKNPNAEPTLNNINLSLFPTYHGSIIKDKIIYVGCYACLNTKKVDPTINTLLQKNKDTIQFTFIHLPIHKEYEYISYLETCLYQSDSNAYWQFHNQLMQMPISEISQPDKVYSLLNNLNNLKSKEQISICITTNETKNIVQSQLQEIRKMNIEGTPTIFINNQVFIGPKPLRVYQEQLSTNINYFGIILYTIGMIIILIILYFIIFKRHEE